MPGAELPFLCISAIFLLISFTILSSPVNKGSSVTSTPSSLLISLLSRCIHTFIVEELNNFLSAILKGCSFVHLSLLSFLSPNIKLRLILQVCPACGLVVLPAGPWAFQTCSAPHIYTSARVSTLCSASLRALKPFLIFLPLYSCLWIKESHASSGTVEQSKLSAAGMIPWRKQQLWWCKDMIQHQPDASSANIWRPQCKTAVVQLHKMRLLMCCEELAGKSALTIFSSSHNSM